MKHQMQEKGWQQMQVILDKEMPARNKRRNYLIPFFILISMSIITYILISKDNIKLLPKDNITNRKNLYAAKSNSNHASDHQGTVTMSNVPNQNQAVSTKNSSQSRLNKSIETNLFTISPGSVKDIV